jgi:hypothetical protein
MTISAAPLELLKAFKSSEWFDAQTATHRDVNPHNYRNQIEDECVADAIGHIIDALNTGNHDRSDIQADYFDVGHYVDLSIARGNKPFVCTAAPVALGA